MALDAFESEDPSKDWRFSEEELVALDDVLCNKAVHHEIRPSNLPELERAPRYITEGALLGANPAGLFKPASS